MGKLETELSTSKDNKDLHSEIRITKLQLLMIKQKAPFLIRDLASADGLKGKENAFKTNDYESLLMLCGEYDQNIQDCIESGDINLKYLQNLIDSF